MGNLGTQIDTISTNLTNTLERWMTDVKLSRFHRRRRVSKLIGLIIRAQVIQHQQHEDTLTGD